MHIKSIKLIRFFTLLSTILGVAVMCFVWSGLMATLPYISKGLSATVGEQQWVINSFGIVMTSTMVIWGYLADRYGRKKMFLLASFIQVASLVVSGLSFNINLIIIMQLLFGLAAGIIMPVSQAIITNAFPKDKVQHAISIWATYVGVALAVGPFLSGLITHYLGWRCFFFIPAGVALIYGFLFFIFGKETSLGKLAHKNDWAGAILLFLSILCFILGVNQWHDWSKVAVYILIAVSILIAIILTMFERGKEYPVLKLELFSNRSFSLSCCITFCMFVCLWSIMFLIPQYSHVIKHYSALFTGFILLFISLPLIIFSKISINLQEKMGNKKIMILGYLFMLLSIILYIFLNKSSSAIHLIIATFCFGITWVCIWNSAITNALSTLPQENAALASGTFATLQELGGNIGLSISVTITLGFSGFIYGFHYTMLWMLVPCVIGMLAAFFIKEK